ncbi:MAG: family 20 glycosylhydrolase [Rikenellaceae bacterium]
MYRLITCFCFILCFFLLSCNRNISSNEYNKGINIIPTPENMSTLEGEFILKDNFKIYVQNNDVSKVAHYFTDKISNSTGFNITYCESIEDADIVIILDSSLPEKREGYHLDVTTDKITLKARELNGVFYGFNTIMQLLPAEIESSHKINARKWSIPAVKITDSPRFEYRGIMLDVSRHFFGVEELKKHLDILSMFKINRFHWHLSDNQGWRIEIKAFPKLTELSSSRVDENGEVHAGFYTTEQVKEIVQYAADRFITVIPEIDIPAHSMAACVAYPQLSCKEETPEIRSVWGPDSIVMCPGDEYMFNFLDTLFNEMCDLFPSEYYHIGGDECPKNSWAACPDCQKRIKDEKLKASKEHTAEERLQSYTIARVEKILAKYNKKIIGWNEILEGGVTETATIMSWKNENGGIEAAINGNDVIMSPQTQGLYLDHYQGDAKVEEHYFARYAPLQKIYAYNPIPDILYVKNKNQYIKGVQANLWTEYVYNTKSLDIRLYPRAFALAEIGWSKTENKDFVDFCRRVENSQVRLETHDCHYHIPLPEQEGGSINNIVFTDSASIEFKTSRPMPIVYTTDGKEPNVNSTRYTESLFFTESTNLKIACLSQSGRTSEVRNISIVKENYAPALNIDASSLKPGIKIKTSIGEYRTPADLKGNITWTESHGKTISDLVPRQDKYTFNRDIKRYAKIGKCYINIPEDGVYAFSTDNDELWIDDKLVVNNVGDIKRHSKNDAMMALAKGVHKVKIVFVSDYVGGWPSSWNDSKVLFKPYYKEREYKVLQSLIDNVN